MKGAIKAKIIAITQLMLLLLSSSLSDEAVGFLADILTIDKDTLTFTSSDGNFNCYGIDGDASGIAIEWAKAPSATPDSLTVPQTITNPSTSTPYTVRAIADGGFRYCDFSTCLLPDTVKDIKDGPFCYCQNLTSFVLPSLITYIAPSTFMDCRELTRVYYSDGSFYSSGGDASHRSSSNSLITKVGDHAFTNCVKLTGFNSPTSLITIEDAAFQGCKRMMSFFFPSKNEGNTNKITVGKYAFADCSSMTLCYFQENLNNVGEFAFAECDKLTIYYTGSSIPSGGNYDTNWRKKHIATNFNNATNDYVPVLTNQSTIEADDENYPGLYWTVQTEAIPVDQAKNTKKTTLVASSTFARIFKFDTPNRNIPGYYVDGVLTIPETLSSQPVKVIKENAFADNADLQGVVFSSNLVQICHHAFYRCTNIASLNFENATGLLEVSHNVFQDSDSNTPSNTALTALHLPNNLQMVGAYAFYKFVNVSAFSFKAVNASAIASTIFIAPHAFGYLGSNLNGTGTVDLVLSPKLDDNANLTHKPYVGTGNLDSKTKYEEAVMDSAFECANCLRSVTMEHQDSYPDITKRTSFAPNAFKQCKSLKRFTSNERIGHLGQNVFTGCSAMREVFLYAPYNIANGKCAWGSKDDGTYGGPIFGQGTTYADAIIYVKPAANAINVNNQVGASGQEWNQDPSGTYANEYSTNTAEYLLCRSKIPTYYDVDWPNDEVKYLDLDSNLIKTAAQLDSSHDCVTLIDRSDHYIATRCYCNANRIIVDLTLNNDVSAKLTEIGYSAFAQIQSSTNYIPGYTIYLPAGLKIIRERAFYRQDSKSTNSRGVQIVTYKDNNSNPITVNGKTAYCVIPPSVTRVERLAFYNNRFQAVVFSGNIGFIGNTCFTTFPNGSNTRGTITSIETVNQDPNFASEGNGLYYIGDASKKTLVFQGPIGNSTSLTIADGTKAIGARACANTNFTTITLDDDVTTIYGGGFIYNIKMTEFVIPTGSNLKYIATTPHDPDTEIWDDTLPFDLNDASRAASAVNAQYASTFGAFFNCTSLTTLNFKNMTNLVKVGYGAFQKCAALEHMTGGDAYTYYKWNSGRTSLTQIGSYSTGVLDLSGISTLISLGRYAFGECPKIKHVHLPSNPAFHLGTDQDYATAPQKSSYSVFASDKAEILVGDTAFTAYSSAPEADTDRYPANAFKDQTPYFHFTSKADIYLPGVNDLEGWWAAADNNGSYKDQTAIKYWIQLPGIRRYLLCNSAFDVRAYFKADSSVFEP